MCFLNIVELNIEFMMYYIIFTIHINNLDSWFLRFHILCIIVHVDLTNNAQLLITIVYFFLEIGIFFIFDFLLKKNDEQYNFTLIK